MNRNSELVQRVRRRTDDDTGMTLIELMIAMFVLAVAVMAIAATAATSLQSVRVARDRDLATSAASAALEAARAIPFEELGLNDDNIFTGDSLITSGEFAHDGSSFEALVITNAGIEPYICDPTTATGGCWFEYDTFGDRHHVATYVTWYDDPSVTGTRNGKRVTVIAEWTDEGTTRTVRQSTIVAESTRGVGIPDFFVTPTDRSSDVAQGQAICFNHLLENFGVEDSYDLWFSKPSGASADPARVDTQTIRITYQGSSEQKGWLAHAWMGDDAHAQAESWKDAWNNAADDSKPAPSADYMREKDADKPLEGPIESGGALGSVPKDASTELAICYKPSSSNPSTVGDVAVLTPLVRSQFWTTLVGSPETSPAGDDGVIDLEHTLTTVAQTQAIYLDDDDEGETDPDGGVGATPFSYDDVVPPTRTLPDFGDDFDSDVPGYGLRKPSNNDGINGDIAVWEDVQEVEGVTFRTATVRIWTSWRDAILFGSTQQQDLALRTRLCVSDGSGNCIKDGDGNPIVAVGDVAYTHDTAGWVLQEITAAFSTDQTVAGGLKLEIECRSGTRERDQNCHLAFDTATFPARIDLSSGG